MDPTFLTALTSLFVASGGGVGFFIKRADTRRKANEDALIAHLKGELEKKDKELEDLKAALRRSAEALDIRTQDARGWREQLVANDIQPIPEQWTPLPKEDR